MENDAVFELVLRRVFIPTQGGQVVLPDSLHGIDSGVKPNHGLKSGRCGCGNDSDSWIVLPLSRVMTETTGFSRL